jgi:hypothetical protein
VERGATLSLQVIALAKLLLPQFYIAHYFKLLKESNGTKKADCRFIGEA